MQDNPKIITKTHHWVNSLSGKFILLTVLILAVTLSGYAIYTYYAEKNLAYNSLNTKINNVTKFIVKISPNAILSFDFNSLNNFMENLTQVEDVIYAVMTTPEGITMTSHLDHGNIYIQPHRDKFKKIDILKLVEKVDENSNIIKKIFPVNFEGNLLANIHVAVSKKRIEEETLNVLQQRLYVSFSIILILCVILYIIFKINTLRPIMHLIEGAKRISSGTLDQEVEVHSNDELGELAQYFNRMMKNLHQSKKEKDEALIQLQDLNRNLENRVESRTHELKKLNKDLEYIALHDALTGLPNRVLIQNILKQNINKAKIDSQPFCVFMMDLDRFKEVNDTLGHESGDSLLIAVSKRLSNNLRKTDGIGRLGGDEFAIILPGTNIENAVKIAKKLIQDLEPAFLIHNRALSISVSIGIASYPQHGLDSTALMKAADVAMYRSKIDKDGQCVYHETMDTNNLNQLNVMGELRNAIRDEDLCLYYQPKINTKSQQIIGVEALVRWNHKTRGLVFPDEFIPLAEQTGLIKPLTALVLKKAIQQSAIWQKNGIRTEISVNLSMHDIQNEDFPTLLSDLMNEYNVSGEQLILEITESTIMSNPENVLQVLEKIAAMDVMLSIDDFGTGYSSLSNLKRMPVHELKIDRSFVMDMANNKDDTAIVQTIIKMAHIMGLKVVAEGVESGNVSKQLIDLDCDVLQGYFFSKPLPVDAITELLERNPSHPLKEIPGTLSVNKR